MWLYSNNFAVAGRPGLQRVDLLKSVVLALRQSYYVITGGKFEVVIQVEMIKLRSIYRK